MEFAAQFKAMQRRTWEAGDWSSIARRIQSASDRALERLDVGPGTTLLDVACGNGNAAIPAAARGADVVGVDLTPDLLALGRERAAREGVEVAFVEGDAEALPVADGAFDRVVSVFGCMFAPRHEVAAAELLRAARPGGRIVVAAWTPTGLNGLMFRTVGGYMPPPPDEFVPPVMWGVEEHVRGLLERDGHAVRCETAEVIFEDESLEVFLDDAESALGPLVLAKAALEPEGRWPALRAELAALYEAHGDAADGRFRAPAEYLLTTVDVAGP